mgnify:CR=1 FL=1
MIWSGESASNSFFVFFSPSTKIKLGVEPDGLPEKVIAEALVKQENTDPNFAKKIAHQAQGNFSKALHLLKEDDSEYPFEQWFVNWVRAAFRAKGNAAAIQDLISWSEEIAGLGRFSAWLARYFYGIANRLVPQTGKAIFWKKFGISTREPLYLIFMQPHVGLREFRALLKTFNIYR